MFAIAMMLISAVVTLVRAERHSIFFINNCYEGTPQLVIGGELVSKGGIWWGNGPQSGIAYLQSDTNECGLNGENCVIVQFTLSDAGSDVAISLIPPHAFNFGIEYTFTNGCGEQGFCASADCAGALHTPGDQAVVSTCPATAARDVGLTITYCPGPGDIYQPTM